MTSSSLIANQLREFYFGGNWTVSHLQEQLSDVSIEDALKKCYSLNSIAELTYHISYFVTAVLTVFKGLPLTANDKESFNHPSFSTQSDWDNFLEKIYNEARELADRINQFPETDLNTIFVDTRYGTYYRNLLGIIEHGHYHLGQIVIIKKILAHENKAIC